MADELSAIIPRRARPKNHGYARHGQETPEYRSWCAARERCRNPHNKDFPQYGGRGIAFDARWDHFPTFLADMGSRPDGMTLERINTDGPYALGNCEWRSWKEQARNRRSRSHLRLKLPSDDHLLDAAERAGISYGTLYQRLLRGWSLEKALSVKAIHRRIYVEWQGRRMKLVEASKIAGLPPAVLQHRLLRGWSVEDALTRPKRKHARGRG